MAPRSMATVMRETVRQSVETGVLVLVPGLLAWLTGFPFIFPSLGPSAYVLATRPAAPTCRPHRVIGGHVIGVGAGLIAFWVFDPGIAVNAELTPASSAALAVAASGVIATVLTAGGMLATDLVHAPACATTLIVSLGLLSTPTRAAGIVAAVVLLVVVHQVGHRSGFLTTA